MTLFCMHLALFFLGGYFLASCWLVALWQILGDFYNRVDGHVLLSRTCQLLRFRPPASCFGGFLGFFGSWLLAVSSCVNVLVLLGCMSFAGILDPLLFGSLLCLGRCGRSLEGSIFVGQSTVCWCCSGASLSSWNFSRFVVRARISSVFPRSLRLISRIRVPKMIVSWVNLWASVYYVMIIKKI